MSRSVRTLSVDDELALTQASLILRRAYPTFFPPGINQVDVARIRDRLGGRFEYRALYEHGRTSSGIFASALIAARSSKETEAKRSEDGKENENKGNDTEAAAPNEEKAHDNDHGTMVGLWGHIRYEANFFGITTPVGGLSSVAADFFNKKRGVAHDLVKQFLYDAREKGQPLTALYAFRPDFYASMGFGNGSTVIEHVLLPSAFPKASPEVRRHYRAEPLPIGIPGPAEDSGREALQACYEKFARDRHGLFVRTAIDYKTQMGFNDPDMQFVGFVDERDVTSDNAADTAPNLSGYIAFKIVAVRTPEGNVSFTQDLKVIEYIHLNPDALGAICAFLRSQADQVRRIYLVSNGGPGEILQLCGGNDNRDQMGVIERRGASTGILGHHGGSVGFGYMLRVVDLRGLIECWASRVYDVSGLRRAFPEKTSWDVAMSCDDTIVSENCGSLLARFSGDGKAQVLKWTPGVQPITAQNEADVSVKMAVQDLSTALVGALNVKQLHRLGLAAVTPSSAIVAVSKLFAGDEPLSCMTYF